jgi:hypothetical protein
MTHDLGIAGVDDEIRFGMTTRQKLVFLPVWLAAAAESLLLGKSVPAVGISGASFWIMFFAVRSRRSSTLSPAGITLWNLRKRLIPWQAIRDIGTMKVAGSTLIQVRLTDGKTVTLRAPQTGPWQKDPDFEAKLATIQAWWRRGVGDAASRPPTS